MEKKNKIKNIVEKWVNSLFLCKYTKLGEFYYNQISKELKYESERFGQIERAVPRK